METKTKTVDKNAHLTFVLAHEKAVSELTHSLSFALLDLLVSVSAMGSKVCMYVLCRNAAFGVRNLICLFSMTSLLDLLVFRVRNLICLFSMTILLDLLVSVCVGGSKVRLYVVVVVVVVVVCRQRQDQTVFYRVSELSRRPFNGASMRHR
jgi:hypothetical protein